MNLPQRKSFHKSSNHCLAVASELLAPALRLGARLAVSTKPSPPAQWRRALIVGDTHIGDLLYRTCSLGQLKRGLPQCELYYLTAKNEAELLRGNQAVDAILPLRTSDHIFDLEDGAWQQLQELRFDAILCSNPVRAWPELAFALKLGIPNRAAYGHRGLSGLITHPVYPVHPQAHPAYFRDMVATLTGQPPNWPLRPVVNPTAADEALADALWHELGYQPADRVIACSVTTRETKGAWPVEWFGRVLQALQIATDCRIVLCGAQSDAPTLAALRQNFGLRAELNAGRLGLRALVSFLRKCRVTFSQDSGVRHLSNAAGTPVVFVRNTWAKALETGVYCDSETDLVPAGIEKVSPQNQQEVVSKVIPETGTETLLKIINIR